jgi:hypothetical protein
MILFYVIAGFAVAGAIFYLGVRYGKRLESDAFDELRRLRAALNQTGVKLEAYYSGDLNRIHNEIRRILKLPQTIGDFIAGEAKAHNIHL